jgi:cob(I)alamin adenosyltransferase
MTTRSRGTKKGLVILNTGPGKGKTTAALGLLLRAWGRGMHVCVIQFIKAETANFGEVKAASKLGIEWHSTGDGWTCRSKDVSESAKKARQGWELARRRIASGDYDLIILDEFSYPLKYGWLDVHGVIAWLKEHKPATLHLVITGRDAPAPLSEYADLVTKMQNVKHPFGQGVRAQPGIEF